MKNKSRVEGSIDNAYLVEESSTFCSHYFEAHVYTRMRKMPRNDDGGEVESNSDLWSIFASPGRPYSKVGKRYLTDQEYHAAQTYILLNCVEIQPYIQ